uniref:Cytochrome c biogenesis protein CcsA n=1 Tax=Floydiella terrestris TaxID=51328 RepID=E2DSI4_FLOTE|nr:heme attachment to plastid cytochrome c [Floydiella terrestris]ACZ58436.1 heme attachment to plastid cytochrome c [Floydiella terrestris]
MVFFPNWTGENFLSNFSFVFLFSTMLFYWVQTFFFSTPKWNVIGFILMAFSNLSLLTLLLLRWKESGHFPLSNLYESLLFLSWSLTSIHLFLTSISFKKTKGVFFNLEKKEVSSVFPLGALLSPCALFTNAFANFSLPDEMRNSSALVPALQSNWLVMHVTIMILSYAALIVGCLLSISFLVLTSSPFVFLAKEKNSSEFSSEEDLSFSNRKASQKESFVNKSQNPPLLMNPPVLMEFEDESLLSSGFDLNSTAVEFRSSLQFEKMNTKKTLENSSSFSKSSIAQMLDNLSYRILGIGFPLLTIGILSGAVWANEAWGSYWSWDPKETWAFLTWLVFAVYLHTRLTKGWQGRKPAIIASIGFVVVWICFLGVNLIGKGLHSYGWIQNT